jgi:hypothetical protein
MPWAACTAKQPVLALQNLRLLLLTHNHARTAQPLPLKGRPSSDTG